MDNITYDYKTIDAAQKNAVEVIDCYEALGWELASKNDGLTGASLTFKRGRKIKNKDQLNRLQVKLDDHLNGIGVLEKRKTQKATAVAIAIGILGALLFGAGICFCMPDVFQPSPAVWMYIIGSILALAGAASCGLSIFSYRKIRAKDTIVINTQIDKKRDEISQICEDAQRLLQLS